MEKLSQTLLSIDISCEAASIKRDNRKMGLFRKVSLAGEDPCGLDQTICMVLGLL